MSEKAVQAIVIPNTELKRRRGRPPTHGAYSKGTMNQLTLDKIKEIREIINGEQMVIAPSDQIYINILGRMLAQMETLDRWFQINGYMADEGRGMPFPCVTHYLNLAKQASAMLEKLGCTPTARYHLGKQLAQTEDIASKIANADRDVGDD